MFIMNSVSDHRHHYLGNDSTVMQSTYELINRATGKKTKRSYTVLKEVSKVCRDSTTASKNHTAMMVLSCLSLFILLDIFVVLVAAKSTATIHTSSGPVQGKVLSTFVKGSKYSAFTGIPYAKPPLGYLRFKPPVPVEPWKTTLNATVEGNVCPQIDVLTKNYTGNEDCLFLNVFTPQTDLSEQPKTLIPVMVWIYGGSFKSGSSTTNLYGPDFLIENDVVVVSFNYRIGALGFLSLNHPNATGNAGLKDQNLVLKWIQNNIAKFGGDPDKVTIFGQSAGAVSVDFHVLSDRSKGLFQRAISMSGSTLNLWGFQPSDQAEAVAKQLGKLLDKSSFSKDKLLQFFYNASPYDLVTMTEKLSVVVPSFRPTLEDPSIAEGEEFMSQCSLDKYNSGNFSKVAYLMGMMEKETVTFAGAVQPIIEVIDMTMSTAESIGMSLPSTLIIFKQLISTASSVVNGISNFAVQAAIDETTDILMKSGSNEMQRILVSKSPEPVYFYQITFNPSVSLHKELHDIDIKGAGHGDELAYIFYMPAVNLPLDPSDPISITRNRVTRMWTNFAKYGNPTPDGLNDPVLNITWPASGSSGIHLDISDNLSVGNRPTSANIELIHLIGKPTARKRNGCPSFIRKIHDFLFK